MESTTLLGNDDLLVRPDLLGPALARATGDRAWREVEAQLITGGKSNLTFQLTCEAGQLILRRPPTGTLLPRAHDMAREARIQRALRCTDVPVAAVVLENPGDLLGVPCYVMERVEGHVIRDTLPDAYAPTTADRHSLAYSLIDVLANLHRLDPTEIGLSDYGRHTGYIERQLATWSSQWQASRTRAVPDIELLAARLRQTMPAASHLGIVHGDYRLDNCVMDADEPARMRAVLDWELSTLGDPLSDLGSMMLFWREPGEAHTSLTPGVSDQCGFPSRADLAARYAALTGFDLSGLAFYEALAHFKFAVIVQGVAARAAAGAMSGQTFGNLDEEVRALAANGLRLLH
jgi:aminoglycoside phosphotransferase (APT) family kinase protein